MILSSIIVRMFECKFQHPSLCFYNDEWRLSNGSTLKETIIFRQVRRIHLCRNIVFLHQRISVGAYEARQRPLARWQDRPVFHHAYLI